MIIVSKDTELEAAERRVRRLDTGRVWAKYTNASFTGLAIALVVVHLMIFVGDTYDPSTDGCTGPGCPPYNGFLDNILSYGWWWLAAIVGVVASRYAWQRLDTAHKLAVPHVETARELAATSEEAAKAEHERTRPYEIIAIWVRDEEFQGSVQTMVYIEFRGLSDFHVGADVHQESFPLTGVDWIQRDSDRREATFPDRTKTQWRYKVQIWSREYPPELPPPAQS